jgi:hypothetical protein
MGSDALLIDSHILNHDGMGFTASPNHMGSLSHAISEYLPQSFPVYHLVDKADHPLAVSPFQAYITRLVSIQDLIIGAL